MEACSYVCDREPLLIAVKRLLNRIGTLMGGIMEMSLISFLTIEGIILEIPDIWTGSHSKLVLIKYLSFILLIDLKDGFENIRNIGVTCFGVVNYDILSLLKTSFVPILYFLSLEKVRKLQSRAICLIRVLNHDA